MNSHRLQIWLRAAAQPAPLLGAKRRVATKREYVHTAEGNEHRRGEDP
jgi:hypothetical protein